MTIRLTPELEKRLVEEAERRGTTPERLVLDSLRAAFVAPLEKSAASDEKTLYDLLEDHIGVLDSSDHVPGGARMSEDTGEKFAAGMLEKRQRRRL
jgi:hypothetical protein